VNAPASSAISTRSATGSRVPWVHVIALKQTSRASATASAAYAAIDPALFGLDDAHLDALAFEPLPREDAGWVFQVGPDDHVAGLPVDGTRDPGDPVGRTLGQGDLVGLGADEVGDALADRLVRLEGATVRVRRRRAVLVVGEELRRRLDDVLGARASARAPKLKYAASPSAGTSARSSRGVIRSSTSSPAIQAVCSATASVSAASVCAPTIRSASSPSTNTSSVGIPCTPYSPASAWCWLVDVDLQDGRVGVVRDRLDGRLHHLTRTAPVRVEVDEDHVVVGDVVVELVGVGQLNRFRGDGIS